MAPSAQAGLLLGGDTPWLTAAEWVGRCVAQGIERVWLSDRGAPVGLAAGLSRRWDRLRIGVAVDPRRRPLTVLAKELTSLDVITGGRLDVATLDVATLDAATLDPGTLDPKGLDPQSEAGGGLRAEALFVLGTLADGRAFHHWGPAVKAEGARCLPPSVQRPSYPLWSVIEAGPGHPWDMRVPEGWDRAGFGWLLAEPVSVDAAAVGRW